MTFSERPSPGARDRFLQAASRQSASRPGAWFRRIGLAAAATIGWLLAILSVLGIRRDWTHLPMPSLMATVLGLTAAALLASRVGLTRGRSMVGANSEVLRLVAAGLPVALFLLVALLDPHGTATIESPSVLPHAWPCGLLVLLIALPLLGLGLWVLRGLVFSRPKLTGACLGLASATWAHLLIRVHCPLGGAGHAIFGHLLPLLPLMAVGAWVLSASGRPKRRPAG